MYYLRKYNLWNVIFFVLMFILCVKLVCCGPVCMHAAVQDRYWCKICDLYVFCAYYYPTFLSPVEHGRTCMGNHERFKMILLSRIV